MGGMKVWAQKFLGLRLLIIHLDIECNIQNLIFTPQEPRDLPYPAAFEDHDKWLLSFGQPYK